MALVIVITLLGGTLRRRRVRKKETELYQLHVARETERAADEHADLPETAVTLQPKAHHRRFIDRPGRGSLPMSRLADFNHRQFIFNPPRRLWVLGGSIHLHPFPVLLTRRERVFARRFHKYRSNFWQPRRRSQISRKANINRTVSETMLTLLCRRSNRCSIQ
jgi:hypothetical protein